MIDMYTREPIRVLTDGKGGGSIWLSVDQIEAVRKVLVENNVPHWVELTAVSVDGGPFKKYIHLRQKADPVQVQALLDAVPDEGVPCPLPRSSEPSPRYEKRVMVDRDTQKPFRVLTDHEGRAAIRLSVDQVEAVRKVLVENNVPHWVEHMSVSVDGGPFMTYIHLRQKADPVQVQALLDAMP